MMRVTRRSYGTIGLAILVLLIALVSAGTVFTPRAHAESASGDSFENAIPLTVDEQVDVNVPDTDTPTYFSFTPSINATFRFYSTRDVSTNVDPYGRLFEHDGSDYVQEAYNDDGGDNRNFSITYTMTAGTTYWLIANVYSNGCAGSYTVHLARTSQVRVQPADGETVYFVRPGQSQTMTVTATTDEDLTVAYQWYRSDGGGNYTPIEGATDASYTATMADAAEEYYKVVATDEYSSGEVAFRLLDDTDSVSALTKEDAVPLALDETKCAKLPHEGACWFVVTPGASGFYGFRSQGNEDSRAELYNAAGDKIAEDDDGGSSSNFYIHNWLDAGQAYYLKVHGVTSSASGCLVDVTLTYDPIDIANGGTARFDDDLHVSEGADDRALYIVEGAGATVTPTISVVLGGNALPAEAFTVSYERNLGFDDNGEELFEDVDAPLGPGRYRAWVRGNSDASYIGQLGPLRFDVVELNSPDYEIISFELDDSYGDGWNGAAIRVVDTMDGSELARLTIGSGGHAEGAVPLVSGHIYQFVWESGSYNSECYFTLRNGEETILEGGGSDHGNGEVLLTYAPGFGPYESYNLWVENTQVANVNAADVLVDGTISYDLETHTLTLDNCVLVSDSSGNATTALIYVDSAEGPVTIDLKGNNVIEGGPGVQYGIYAGAGVTFTGDGSLTAIGGGSTSSSTASFGIFASGDITLDGSFAGTLVAKGGATSGNTYGISGSTVTVNGGTLVAVGGVGADGKSIGLHAGSSLSVTGGTVIAQGGTVAKGNTIGVSLGDSATINVSGGTFLVQGGNTTDASGYSRGVYCGNGGQATFSGGASVVRAGAIGAGNNRFTSSNRQSFSNCGRSSSGMSTAVVGYTRLTNRFTDGSNPLYSVYRETGFVCEPSSWKNLSDISSGESGDITLSNDCYYINGTSPTSPAIALSNLDTNGHELFVVNLFEGDPNNRSAGLVFSNTGDVSLTGAGSVVTVGGLTTADPSFGLYAAGSLTVTGPTVIGVSGQGNAGSDGVSCAAGLLTVDSGKVIGVGSSPNSSSNESHGVNSQDLVASGTSAVVGVGGIISSSNTYGIRAQHVTTQDSASVLGVGGSVSGAGANSYGISADSVEETGGTAIGVGGDCAASSCGVDSGVMQVHRGSKLIAVGGNQTTDHSYGINGLTSGGVLEGNALIAGTTSAIGSSDGALQLADAGLALGYTDYAGTADEAIIENSAALSALTGFKNIKVDTPPDPLTSGTWGTCYWEITPEKVLMVYPGELDPALDGYMPWYPKYNSTWEISDIQQVVIVSRGAAKVIAPSDSYYILGNLEDATTMDLSGLDTSQAQDLSHLFASSNKLESIDVSMLDTSNATTMQSMFHNCTKLESLDLSSFDTTNVTSTQSMFAGCTSLESLNLSGLDMASVTNASYMFENCGTLGSLDLSTVSMANVTDARSMFAGCASLESLDLSSLGMSKVTNAYSMFSGCTSLKSLDLSTLDTTKSNNVLNMFSGCTSLESLKLGSACKLTPGAGLPEAPATHPYTGKWVREEGGEPLTAEELMSTYVGATMAGTYVWEKITPRTLEQLEQLIATATSSPYSDPVQASIDGTDVYTVDKWVTQEALDALTAAVEAAQQVLGGEEPTQAQIDYACIDLEAAIANYDPQPGTKVKELVLVGSWSDLYEQLRDNGSIIKLTQNVKYGEDGGDHAFDELMVPAGFSSSLDLNGHIVDRGLGQAPEAVEGGSVIDVFGTLTITDSDPDAAHEQAFTFQDPLDAETDITVVGGIITGGFAVSRIQGDEDYYFGGGGVLVESNAQLVMTGGSICNNRASDSGSEGGGGGVAVKPDGILDMSGTAAICGNTSAADGGGVFLHNAHLNMDGDASICGNYAVNDRGGGVRGQTSHVTMKGNSNITGNKVDGGVNGWGGGLDFNYSSSLTMEDNAAIVRNVASGRGGGVAMSSWFSSNMVVTMKGNATISNNTCGDFGGGVYLLSGVVGLNMSDDASIVGNRAGSQGGGVFVDSGSVYMSGGVISGNMANGSGGGIGLDSGTSMTMAGGTITGNSTRSSGGGVYAERDIAGFDIAGTVVIDGNETVDDNGEHVSDSNLHGAAGSGSSMAVPITVAGALGEDSAIGITQWGVPGEDSPVDAVSGFAENNPDADPLSIFTSDTNDYIVIVSADGEPQLALPKGVGIWIGGKQVNVLNASDVFGDGAVSYDQTTKTLTLNGYHFDGYGEMTHHAALATTVENLTVNVVGENKIVESGYHNWYDGTDCFGIWAANGLNITGSGTLETWAYYMNTNETTGAGIFLASGSLNICEGFTGELLAHANRGIGVLAAGDVLVTSGKIKFAGDTRAVEADSVFLGKDLAAFGSESADMEDGVVLATNADEDPLDITELAGEAYKSIWTEPFECYDLWVNGERLSTVDLAVDCGDGTAVFDPDAETPTLTLTNATITNHLAGGDVDACVYSELPNLVVKTVGQNLIKPTESGVDGVGSADGCNIAVVSEADNPGSLKLEDVNFGFNIGGTIDVAGNLETISTAGGTNVPDSAITLAEGWSYTTGTSLTQSGNVVIEQVVTLTFDGNGHGDVLATMQVPKGKSANSAYNALSEEARAELQATAGGELTDGDKTYQVYDYSTSPDGSLGANWDAALYEDTTWYAQWVECVTLVEIAVEPPVCGTTTETSKNSQGNWEFDTQTNKPVGSVAGSNYVLPEGENGWFAAWCAGPAASIDADSDSLEPYVGEFTGGDSYTLLAYAQATGGCIFSKDVVVKVNGVECKTLANYDSIWNRGYIGFVTEVTAAHNLEETPEVPATCTDGGFEAYWTCSACEKTFSDAAGTQEVSAPVATQALGHAWGDWEIVTEATTGTEGLARRVCTNNPSHVDERPIPKLKEVEWKRLAGQTRYDTMSEIVKEGFTKSNWAVIATGENFPDALAASALAGYRDCPVVLTLRDSLSPQARSELVRLGVKNVYIMGGTFAVSANVEKQVKALNGGISVTRVAGSDRLDTSVKVMNIVKGASDTVIVATGQVYADSLSIGSWSYATKSPIVLTKADGTLTPAEVAAIKAAGYRKFVIVGGSLVVKDSVKSQLSGLEFVGRLGGANRYETSKLIAEFSLNNGLTAKVPAVATGANYPDALAGAALQGKIGSILVLVNDESSSSLQALTKNAATIERGYVLGGKIVIPDSLVAHLRSIIAQAASASVLPSSDAHLTAANVAF